MDLSQCSLPNGRVTSIYNFFLHAATTYEAVDFALPYQCHVAVNKEQSSFEEGRKYTFQKRKKTAHSPKHITTPKIWHKLAKF